MDEWLKDLRANSSPDIKVFLIGNKADLENERVVKKEVAENFKNDYDLNFFRETSAKTGFNATEIFTEAALLLYNDYCKYKNMKTQKIGAVLKKEDKDKNNNDKKKKKQCCK